MMSIDLVCRLLSELELNTMLPTHCERMEIRPAKFGGYRLFVAFGPGTSVDDLTAAQLIGQGMGLSMNPWSQGGKVLTATFVSDSEPRRAGDQA